MNRAEFIRLAERYMGTVYKVALNSTGNTADAEDITQNTFIKLLQSEIEYKNDEHVRKWLIRVAVNEGHDLHRMQQRKKTVPIDEMTEDAAVHPYESSELFQAVQELPLKYRQIVHLYYYEGLKVKEIAGIMNLTISAVQTRLKRARNRLKEMLKEM